MDIAGQALRWRKLARPRNLSERIVRRRRTDRARSVSPLAIRQYLILVTIFVLTAPSNLPGASARPWNSSTRRSRSTFARPCANSRNRRSDRTSWSGTKRRFSRSRSSRSSASSATWARSFPEEYGGAGLGYVDYSIIIEELSRVDGSVGIIVAAHTSLCSNHIYKSGSEEQRRRYLPKLATGEWLGCWSLTEPEAGSDAAGTRTTAVRQGECWVLNGSKTFTTNAHYADVCVAMAVTDRGAGAARHFGVHHRERHARLSHRQERKQARSARQRHRRSDFRELPPAGRRSCSASAARASSIA